MSIHLPRAIRVRYLIGGLLAIGVALPASLAVAEAASRPESSSGAVAAFDQSATRYDVPRDLLVALGYAETHVDDHGGAPSASNGYGVMHLVSNPTHRTLDEAATLTDLSVEQLKTETTANVAGAAAVLRSYADAAGLSGEQRRDINTWYQAVAEYGGATSPAVARLYADTVYNLLASGFTANTDDGRITVPSRPIDPDRGDLDPVAPMAAATTLSTDYGPAHWVAANSSNYRVSSRTSSYPIKYVVIHVAQGSYAGTISWFQNPSAKVSSHYVIRSSDGDITQMVRHKDVAWHAGNSTYNNQSIGIEHEGYVSDASWFTDAMYRSSAALVRSLCDTYGIPKDRSHIVGHNEVPGATHTDPAPNWNWTKYMQLITGSAGTASWSTIVDNTTSGGFSASANWGTSTYSSQRYGANYRYANPTSSSDVAWYKVNIPQTASYRIEAWYPATSGYNDRAPYIVATSSGNKTVYINQRSNGGKWVSVGTFTLSSGSGNKVGVSRWTGGTGYVIADAIRITRV